METVINVPFTNELDDKSIQELKKLFELWIKDKKHLNYSFEKHIIYYEFAVISIRNDFKYPEKEIQENYLKEKIRGFEEYIDYKIEPLCLASGNEDRNKRYFLKGKFKDEKQFYIFALTH